MNKKPPLQKSTAENARKQRLARALRENLRRRKNQRTPNIDPGSSENTRKNINSCTTGISKPREIT